jgi:hypothetical protein
VSTIDNYNTGDQPKCLLSADFHPDADLLEILPVALLLHAAVFAFGCLSHLLSHGNAGRGDQGQAEKAAA